MIGRSLFLVAIGLVFLAVPAGAAEPQALAGDDVGLVDPSSGMWYLRDGGGGTTSFYYGNPGDVPFVGDWDCDGVDTPGLYRQSDGYVYLRDTNTQGIADVSFFFGNPGDVPLAGDFDGDGCDSVSLYRPSEARFYVINELGDGDAGLGAAAFSFVFGDSGDVPFVGDFDTNGTDSFGVYRRSTSSIHVKNALATGAEDDSAAVAAPRAVPVSGTWGIGAEVVGTYDVDAGVFHVPDGDVEYGYGALHPIAGAFGPLPGGGEDPPTAPPYPDVGEGKRIIYSNSGQHVWLIDENERLVSTYPVTGRKGIPGPGTYSVFSKSVNAYAPYGGITMQHMVRFAWGTRWAYGFHSIPRYSDGRPMQTEAELGTFGSGGCVRQADHRAKFLFDWAPIGTTVIVLP